MSAAEVELAPEKAKRRWLLWLQIALLVAGLAFGAIAGRNAWGDVEDRLRTLDPWLVAAAALVLAAYYLLFVVGWMIILRALGMRISYRHAIGAEMLSMLAKYVPGGVWTPAARVVACERVGLAPGPVLASIGYEAGLSAISGIIVLIISLPFAPSVDVPVPIWGMIGFAAVLLVLLHPAIYGRATDRFLGRLSDGPIPRLPLGTATAVLGFYCLTWPIGGTVLWLLGTAVGGDIPVEAIPFLGGASALGAIVAVLVVVAPSGLGVREGAVFALLLAYLDRPSALVVVALNRLLITAVEAALLAIVTIYGRLVPSP